MYQEFLKYNKENNLFDIHNDRILLAVSGGADSMVMADLFRRLNCKYAIAHCNFHLRGTESDRDEEFVSDYAARNNILIFKQEFDTFAYMEENKKSLEMSARDLRYDWFGKIMQQHGFTLLATAHHGDDSAETFLINLLRGTGIAGLHGILPKIPFSGFSNKEEENSNTFIIRPMLFTSRRKILQYSNKHNILYVEDSTNKDNKYTRNKIRNEIVPVLREISPNFDVIIRKDIERLRETEQVFREVIDRTKKDILVYKNGVVEIETKRLKVLQPLHIYLYEILSEFGFNETNINSICDAIDDDNSSGKQFFSDNYRLLIDRKHLFIIQKETEDIPEHTYTLSDWQTDIVVPVKLHTEVLRDLNFIKIPKSKSIAMFDYDKLKFPLTLRHWHKGDSFIPFGLNGKQKLSDYFSNNKFSIFQKESQWLLCSDEDIIWVVGERIDDRYKITDKTKTIFKLELE
ncbi:MAG: tRNA lysidine(34) synthetase TilS [Bacteroidales bacterium]|nr:tRNA lysidine(34) synthetase TilS [Bacteroidales bacterium]